MCGGVFSEMRQEGRRRGLGFHRKTHPVLRPQLIEIGNVEPARRRIRGKLAIEMSQPSLCVTVFGEGFAMPHTRRKLCEDRVIIACLCLRRDQGGHVEEVIVQRAAADVLALKRGCRGEDDVGALGGCCPPRLVHDNRLWAFPRLMQTVEILMMVERVATRPIDQTDIGVGRARAVEIERLIRMQQHIRDPCDRDHLVDGVPALIKGHPFHRFHGFPDATNRAVAIADPAPREANLTEHRGQNGGHPIGLLAVMATLQGPCHGDQGAGARHASGECVNILCRHPAQGCGPVR